MIGWKDTEVSNKKYLKYCLLTPSKIQKETKEKEEEGGEKTNCRNCSASPLLFLKASQVPKMMLCSKKTKWVVEKNGGKRGHNTVFIFILRGADVKKKKMEGNAIENPWKMTQEKREEENARFLEQ